MRRAFTLIELLVVIAVISILAAVLFPVFARVREKARQATCQSNLRQIGVAYAQYTQDYDEAYPCDSSDPYLWEGQHFRWPIMPYLAIGQARGVGFVSTGGPNSAAILHCPSDTATSFDSTSYAYSAAFYHTPAQLALLTNYNCLYTAAAGCPALTQIPQSVAQVATPSQKILSGEWADNHDGQNIGGWWNTSDAARNFVFADGHVKYLFASRMTIGADGFADPNVTLGGLKGSDVP